MAKGPRTIDEYLAGQRAKYREALLKVRRAIRAAASHCSFHPMSGATVATLRADLAKYDTSTGTIRFSPRAPFDGVAAWRFDNHNAGCPQPDGFGSRMSGCRSLGTSAARS